MVPYVWLRKAVICLGVLIASFSVSYGQSVDSLANKALNFPSKLFNRIKRKAGDLDQQLTRQTEKYLQKMARQEQRLKKKLAKKDSVAAARLFANSEQQYAAMMQKFKADPASFKSTNLSGTYQPYTDSLGTALRFLQQNPQFTSAAGKDAGLVQDASAQFQQLQGRMQNTEAVNAFVQQRRQLIKQYLSQYTHLPAGLDKEYQGLNQQAYYYTQQVQHYKDMLNNPDELEKKALSLLRQTSAFQDFMRSNSQLASLFHLPGNSANSSTPQAALAGLQTRDQLQQMIQGQIAPGGQGGMDALSQNIQSAQSQLSTLKDRLRQYGTGGGNIESPDFKPNNQKTKTFWGRLEYGANVQTSRTNYNFPTVTDFALTVGYKLNNRNSVGVGASYKMGWGSGINHIALSSQGVGLRSYLNIQIKGSWSATGGLEYNYETPFSSFKQIHNLDWWTRSGLVGVMKTVSVKSRFLKKTTMQLLWDFLSYQQVPKTQPILFRVGYGF
ncbi:hypothetical protein GCM10011511_32470 [Puia dinghuensis]|uniref:Uncharacterized protein n=1 Tax=Puia dinghuensis TaxID=1792502 RepID=A0A8J2XUC0_9BACT|nr:hypothetical protein GCM10011511_32470 [Puia dinghuensis]